MSKMTASIIYCILIWNITLLHISTISCYDNETVLSPIPTEEGYRQAKTAAIQCNGCSCMGPKATCEGLDFIPKLPHYVTLVDFTNNNLRSIDSAHFFENISKILALKISISSSSSDDIVFLGDGIFDNFQNLISLDLNVDTDRLSEDIFTDSVKTRLRHFSFTPQFGYVKCCSVRWIGTWILNNPQVFGYNITDCDEHPEKDQYKCVSGNYNFKGINTPWRYVDVARLPEQVCLLPVLASFLIWLVAGLTLLIYTGCVCRCCCKNTWSPKKGPEYVRTQARNRQERVLKLFRQRPFKFDVFVSYAEVCIYIYINNYYSVLKL